jgi:hypothetical protein
VCGGGSTGTLGASFPPALDRGSILSDPTPDPVPAELAPFLAQARTGLEAATDGLQPQEAIEHLQSTLARTEIEASRLGIRFDRGMLDADSETVTQADGLGPVVVIRRLVEDSDN